MSNDKGKSMIDIHTGLRISASMNVTTALKEIFRRSKNNAVVTGQIYNSGDTTVNLEVDIEEQATIKATLTTGQYVNFHNIPINVVKANVDSGSSTLGVITFQWSPLDYEAALRTADCFLYPKKASGSDAPTAYNVFKSADAYNSIVSGVWLYYLNPTMFFYGWFINYPYVVGDEIDYKFSQKAGSFTFCLLGSTDAGYGGHLQISIDGAIQGTIATETGVGPNTVWTLPISVLTDGEHILDMKVVVGGANNLVRITSWWIRD